MGSQRAFNWTLLYGGKGSQSVNAPAFDTLRKYLHSFMAPKKQLV